MTVIFNKIYLPEILLIAKELNMPVSDIRAWYIEKYWLGKKYGSITYDTESETALINRLRCKFDYQDSRHDIEDWYNP